MHKIYRFILGISLLFASLSIPIHALAKSSTHVPAQASPSDVIAAVNAIRSAHGLSPFQPNSILMSVAQAQAEYMAAIGSSVAESDGQGRRGYQRALLAGYMIAGNLSNGSSGFFSELHDGGIGMTSQEAVDWWYNEPISHRPTLLSSIFVDVGVGIANVGNTYYYCLDAGLSTGGTPVAYTPPAPLSPSTPTIIPNTPNPDGSVIHIVQRGDTLGSLSMAYNVPLANILKLNNLTIKSVIFVGQKIIIQPAYTPTPTQPTSTPTIPPTTTPWPTSTATATATAIPPTPTPSPGLPVSAAGGAVAAIVITALILSAVVALIGRKRK